MSHLVPLGKGSWRLWRWVWLRGAGFPARPMLSLGSDDLLAQLEALRLTEDRAEGAHRAAIDACVAAAAGPTANQAIKSAASRLKASRVPAPTGNAELDAAIESYRVARIALAAARERTVEIVQVARAKTAEALQGICRDPRFREALVWQNRGVLHNAVDRMLETAPAIDDHKARERQR